MLKIISQRQKSGLRDAKRLDFIRYWRRSGLKNPYKPKIFIKKNVRNHSCHQLYPVLAKMWINRGSLYFHRFLGDVNASPSRTYVYTTKKSSSRDINNVFLLPHSFLLETSRPVMLSPKTSFRFEVHLQRPTMNMQLLLETK